MTKSASELKPFMAIHPGEMLKDEFEFRGIDSNDFAEKLGLSVAMLNAILDGKNPVTSEFALTMEAALGVNADMLVRMQGDYDIYQSRHNVKFVSALDNIRRVAASILI